MSNRVSALFQYPVKSCAPVPLSEAMVEPAGLVGDRRFIIVDEADRFITGREFPVLTQVRCSLGADDLSLQAPGREMLNVRVAALPGEYVPITVWHDTVDAQRCGAEADAWLSDLLGGRFRLVHMGTRSWRGTKLRPRHPVSFADAYPLLAFSEASVAMLNGRLPIPVSVRNFRPNLVISGSQPFEEDSWARIRVGEVEFDLVKGCDRCVFTTIDPASGRKDPEGEPLRTLSRFRRDDDGQVYLGQNLVPLNEGTIRVGDTVEVIEQRRTVVFPDRMPFLGDVAPGVHERRSALTAGPAHSRARTLHCTAVVNETPDVRTFRFELDSPDRFDFLPGQFITVAVDIDGESLRRCYSLASSPEQSGMVEITVKRHPGGRVSNWLHDNLSLGDSIEAAGPAGRFHYMAAPGSRLLLLSAGSGITPMLSITRWLADAGVDADVVFHHSARRQVDLVGWDGLKALSHRMPKLRLSCNLTAEAGPGSLWTGRLTEGMLSAAAADVAERTVFLCGPEGFMKRARTLLRELGVPRHRMLEERYVVGGEQADAAAGEGRRVRFTRSGKEAVVHANQSVLEIAESVGIEVPNSCRGGVCGSCRSLLETGRVSAPDTEGLDEADRRDGWFLPCCSFPATDVDVAI